MRVYDRLEAWQTARFALKLRYGVILGGVRYLASAAQILHHQQSEINTVRNDENIRIALRLGRV